MNKMISLNDPIDLKLVELGKDEAESDRKLKDYFLQTEAYRKAKEGRKSFIVGRKGSGKSAIFKLLSEELKTPNTVVITPTIDTYLWRALAEFKEQGIANEVAYTNAWKLTLYSAIIWKMSDGDKIIKGSKLNGYNKFLRYQYKGQKDDFIQGILKRVRGVQVAGNGIEIEGEKEPISPLTLCNALEDALKVEWPDEISVRILLDRLDEGWDASEQSKNLLIGLFKAVKDINGALEGVCQVTVFIRSDIYESIIFGDKDKFRESIERIRWTDEELKRLVCMRIQVSLKLHDTTTDGIWYTVFKNMEYKSRASPEKYLIDRTFKRPRDILSFVRFSLEMAVANGHEKIISDDVYEAERSEYSKSKYEDILIEYKDQYPFIKTLLDRFSNQRHELSKNEIDEILDDFISSEQIRSLTKGDLLQLLYGIGFLGFKKVGNAGIGKKFGTHFFYYYDGEELKSEINEFYIHPAFRKHLGIVGKRNSKETDSEEVDEENS